MKKENFPAAVESEKEGLVAIIILNYNKKKDILECLKSVSELNYKSFEVIAVDNFSTDGSAEEIRKNYPEVHLIENKINSGVAGGRNLGINYAKKNLNYKFLLFLDNDIIIYKNAVTEMISSFSGNEKIGIVTPKCYAAVSPKVIGYAGGIKINLFTGNISNIGSGEKDEGQFDKSGFISSSGGLCMVSAEVINEVGQFDERFNPYGWEDVDFSLRARKKGYKILYNFKAEVFHKGGPQGRGKNELYEYSKSKNYFYLIKKHANFFQLAVFLTVFPFKIFWFIIKETANGDFKIISAQLKGILSLLK